MSKQELNVLLVTSSARQQGSVTRQLTDELLVAMRAQHPQVRVQQRDVAQQMPFIDEMWVSANFTPERQRNDTQKQALATSDALVAELQQADVILIAVPIYNFSIPASLKAWIDQIARAGLTFSYTSDGPVGRLHGKRAYVVLASGGTEIGSEIDFASVYLKHVLGFIGIHQVELIAASRYRADDEQTTMNLRQRMTELAQQVA